MVLNCSLLHSLCFYLDAGYCCCCFWWRYGDAAATEVFLLCFVHFCPLGVFAAGRRLCLTSSAHQVIICTLRNLSERPRSNIKSTMRYRLWTAAAVVCLFSMGGDDDDDVERQRAKRTPAAVLTKETINFSWTLWLIHL